MLYFWCEALFVPEALRRERAGEASLRAAKSERAVCRQL